MTPLLLALAALPAFHPAPSGNVHERYGPHRFPLDDGRVLVTAWDSSQPTCWLEGAGTSTFLGGCAVLSFGSAGYFVVRDTRIAGALRAEVLDVDPARDALRVVWSSDTVERIVPVGGAPGALWFFADATLVRVREREQPVEFQVGSGFLPAGVFTVAQFPSGDAIRGGRLLVASFDGRAMHADPGRAPVREAELAVLDLERQVTRPLGRFPAVRGIPLGETIYLPVLELAWARSASACERPTWGATHRVLEDGEAVFVAAQ